MSAVIGLLVTAVGVLFSNINKTSALVAFAVLLPLAEVVIEIGEIGGGPGAGTR